MKKKKVTIMIDEQDMDYIEDIIFCQNSEKELEEMRPRLNAIWMQLCDEMEKEE